MRAPVWNFFEKLSNTGTAKCIACGQQYSYRTTTSNLQKHLKTKHSDFYNQLLELKDDINMKRTIKEEDEEHSFLEPDSDNNSSDYHPLPPSPRPKKVKQERDDTPSNIERTLCLQNNTTRKATYSLSEQIPTITVSRALTPQLNDTVAIPCSLSYQQKQLIDKILLKMIIQDYQPITIVDEQGFQNFAKAMNPNYELPDRTLISGTLIPKMYTECKTFVMNLVEKAEYICLTIERWTSLAKYSFVAMTAHFTLDFQQQSVLLQCQEFNESDPYALTTSVTNIVQEYQIGDKIKLAVSNDVLIKNATAEIKCPFFGCFLHKINLAVQEAITNITDLIDTVKRVVSHFKNNITATEALLNLQRDSEENSMALHLIQYDPTQWNTVFYMLQRFLKLQNSLKAVIPSLGVEVPGVPSKAWHTIEQICLILRPFEEATSAMSGAQYLTASLAIVIVDGLKNVLNLMQLKPITGVAKNFLIKLEHGFKKYFPEKDFEHNMLLGVCTFLDPRFKIHAFLDSVAVNRVTSGQQSQRTRRAHLIKNHVLELVKHKISEKQKFTTIAAQDPLSLGHKTSTLNETESISIWGKIDKNIAGVTATYDEIFLKAHNEVEMFLNEEVLSRDSCPMSWWKSRTLVYPNLAEIYRQHCHIVVTSVQCDRAFSKAGNILMDKRARLSRKHTPQLVFLHNNSHLLE